MYHMEEVRTLSLIEYGDVIYSGTSQENIKKIDRLFYRGLCIYVQAQMFILMSRICVWNALLHR